MNSAERDQALAGARDNAEHLKISLDALTEVGFAHADAIQILYAGILRDAGIFQAQAMDRFVAQIKASEEE